MSVDVMRWVWKHGPMDGTERLVLLAIADHADDNGSCYPSMAGIAEKACVTERGARGVVRRLEEAGWLHTKIGGGRGGKSRYRVLMVKNPEGQTRNEKPGISNPESDDHKPGTLVPPNHQEPSVKRERGAGARRFQDFWDAYPHRGGVKRKRADAERKYERIVKSGVPEQTLIDAAKRHHGDRQVIDGYARDPTSWLTQRGWEDEIEPPQLKVINGGPRHGQRFDEAHREYARRVGAGLVPRRPDPSDPFA